jgi:hypothetical protein
MASTGVFGVVLFLGCEGCRGFFATGGDVSVSAPVLDILDSIFVEDEI